MTGLSPRGSGRVIRVAGEAFLIPAHWEYLGLDSEGLPLISDTRGVADAPLLEGKEPNAAP